MRIRLAKEIRHRAINSIDLLLEYVFKDNVPNEFVSDKVYTKGDLAYVLTDTELTIYRCVADGYYVHPTEPGWTEADIYESEDYIEATVRSVIERLYMNSDFDACKQSVHIGSVLNQRIVLADMNRPKDIVYNMDVYTSDLCYVSKNDYEITSNGIKFIYDTPDFEEFFIIIKEYNDKLYTLVHNFDIDVDNVPEGEHTLFVSPHATNSNTKVMSFLDGELLSYVCDINADTGEALVEIPEGKGGGHLTLKVSQSTNSQVTMVGKTKYISELKQHERYRIDLRHSNYDYMRDDVDLYVNNKFYLPDKYVLNKNNLSVCNMEDYLEPTDSVLCRMVNVDYAPTMTVDEIAKSNTSIVYTIGKPNQLNIPIPLMEYSRRSSEFMVFRESGNLIPPVKYYLKGRYLQFFQHDIGMLYDDFINVVSTNNDIHVDEHIDYIAVESPDQTEFTIPIVGYPDKFKGDFLLFDDSGMFISPRNYTITGNTLTLDSRYAYNLRVGDALLLYVTMYTHDMVKSYKTVVSKPVTTGQRVINIPLTNYNPHVDKMILFYNGIYIGASCYVVENNTIRITDFSEFETGNFIDIVFIKMAEESFPAVDPYQGKII